MELRGTGEEEIAAAAEAAAGEVEEGVFFVVDALRGVCEGDFFVVDALRGAEDEVPLLRGFEVEDARRVGAIFK